MRDVVDDWYTCYFALYRSARYLEARLKELEMYRQKKDSDVLAQAWKDTLKELERENTRLFLMLGTDMVLTFDTWYRFEDILKMCYPVYVRRENDPLIGNRIVSKISDYYQKYGVMFRRIVTEPIQLSSTEIRRAVAEGKDISGLVPKGVAEFIEKNGLYRRSE